MGESLLPVGTNYAEVNLVLGNCSLLLPVKPGSMGRPIPGHVAAYDLADASAPCWQHFSLAPSTALSYTLTTEALVTAADVNRCTEERTPCQYMLLDC